MYLKSLEMQGFKSFPDKTKLIFENGTSVIVGPNGSGKSNISDAMRWVLGEISIKNIRGSKMEDIIFGGADSRRPMGYAEVSVTFDNTGETKLDCPYDEVTVTRRYFRSSPSEYYINKQEVKLKDIYELFMNTGIGRDGYSIIGQGKIDEIISRKSDERRDIFEDAAGIAKYRHKKTETEKKLAATDDNMVRINDVFTEVSAQVGPLEKEAEKARKAIALIEAKKQADVQLWLYDTDRLRTDIAIATDEFNRSAFDLQTAEEAISELEKQNERLMEVSQNNKLVSARLLSRIKEQTEINFGLDSEYRVTQTSIAHTEQMRDSALRAAETLTATLTAEREQEAKREEKSAGLSKQLEETQKIHSDEKTRLEELSEEYSKADGLYNKTLTDIRRIENELTDISVRISVTENAKKTDVGKNASIAEEIKEYESISDDLRRRCEAKQATVKSYGDNADRLNEKLASIGDNIANQARVLSEYDKTLSELRLLRDSLRQRIDTIKNMEEQFEGYNNSVRFVMSQYEKGLITDAHGVRCSRIYGPLSRVISVEDKYLTAIETALGANLQNIVVADENAAKAAMYCLKRAEAGMATFFPLTSMRPQSTTTEMRGAKDFRGYVGVADELCGCEDRFSNVVSALLGRTLIFDNIDNATVMARAQGFRVRVVTLDGQQINAGGSFTGGSYKRKSGLLGRAGLISRLEEEFSETEKKYNETLDIVKATQSAIEKLENGKRDAEDRIKLMLAMKNAENNALEQLKAKAEANDTLTEKLRADYNTLREIHSQYEENLQELCETQTELKRNLKNLTELTDDLSVKLFGISDSKDACAERITELYIAINSLEKDIETEATLLQTLRESIEQHITAIDFQNAEAERYAEQKADCEECQLVNRENFKEGSALLEKLNAERAEAEAGDMEYERKLNATNTRLREKMSQKEMIFRVHTKNESKLASLRASLDSLSSKLYDDYEMTRADAVALNYPTLTAQTRPEAAAKQTECRNKLRVVGHVDLDADNKYREIKTRYDYMKAQIEDLTAAKTELLGIINELERDMKKTFIECFEQINQNFNRTFEELFGGGSAQLSLTDPDDVLSSGIEIKAAPPGKIIKNLMQLSGGEQAFIAIALFFAILKYSPTPFCILDEIEAALDEVNVVRFAEYIKRYSKETQFIIITHRRGTMEAADRLYGVTMPEHGISKVIALNIDEMSKKKGEDWDGIF